MVDVDQPGIGTFPLPRSVLGVRRLGRRATGPGGPSWASTPTRCSARCSASTRRRARRPPRPRRDRRAVPMSGELAARREVAHDTVGEPARPPGCTACSTPRASRPAPATRCRRCGTGWRSCPRRRATGHRRRRPPPGRRLPARRSGPPPAHVRRRPPAVPGAPSRWPCRPSGARGGVGRGEDRPVRHLVFVKVAQRDHPATGARPCRDARLVYRAPVPRRRAGGGAGAPARGLAPERRRAPAPAEAPKPPAPWTGRSS